MSEATECVGDIPATPAHVLSDITRGADLPSGEDSFEKVMIDAVNLQDGINDLNDSKATVAAELMQCAARFVEGDTFTIGTSPTARGDLKGDPIGFLGKCYEAELFIKDPGRAGNFYSKTIPKCWNQAKSNIVRAWVDFGMLVTTYQNDKGQCIEKRMRDALNEARKEARGDDAKSMALATLSVKDTQSSEEGVAPSLDLGGILKAIAAQYEGLPPEKQEKMLQSLIKVHQQYRKVLETIVPVTPTAPSEEGEQQGEVINH